MTEEIPYNVLIDYQNRTVVAVTNLRWDNAEQTMLTADVLFEELQALGPIPFSTQDGADTAHGQEIWDKAIAGDYGPIPAYAAPSIENVRLAMPRLTPRQIRLGMLSVGITESQVDAALANDAYGLIEWKYATEFSRTHPLIDALGTTFQLTPEQIDSLWIWSADI